MSTCCEVFCLLSLVGLVTSSGVASGYLQVRRGAVGRWSRSIGKVQMLRQGACWLRYFC